MNQQLIINETPQSLFHAIEALKNLDRSQPHTVTIAPLTKRRTKDQNKLQWKSMLGDIASQAMLANRYFGVKVWHEYMKEKFLPETYQEGITLKDYEKWLEMPDGRLKMIGSTTKLTTKGMSDYLEQCYAFGCDLGVRFSASPRDY